MLIVIDNRKRQQIILHEKFQRLVQLVLDPKRSNVGAHHIGYKNQRLGMNRLRS